MPYSTEAYSTEAYAGNGVSGSAPVPVPTVPIYSQGYWKSSPQPVQDGVVCLYLDVRNNLEQAQVFDTMQIDPLFSGNSMNIYYSSDDSIPSVFGISRNYISLQTPNTATVPTADNFSYTGLDFGINQYVAVPNLLVDQQPLPNPFTFGMTMTLVNNSVNCALASYLTAAGFVDFTYQYTDSALVISIRDNVDTLIGSVSFDSLSLSEGVKYGLVWGWNGTEWSLTIDGSPCSPTIVGDVTPWSNPIANIAIGYTPSAAIMFVDAGVYISYVWIRQQAPNIQAINQYVSTPDGFIDAKGNFDVTNGAYNALLLGRFTVDTSAFVGPNSDWFTAKVWSPIQRDFSLQKGTYTIPTINAKYLKFEISNLTVQPYLFDGDSITRMVQLFPDWVTSYYQNTQNIVGKNTAGTYQSFNSSNVSPSAPYNNIETNTLFGAASTWLTGGNVNPNLLYQNQSSLGSYTWIYPNTVTYVQDPTSSINKIDLTGAQGNLLNTNNPVETWLFPRFPFVGVHQYKYMTVTQTWKQAYYAGIVSLNLYLSNPIIPTNTPEYFEPCYTNSKIIASTDMVFVPNEGYSCALPGETIVTHTLESIAPVQAVQIAAVTSDWGSNGVGATDIICNAAFTGLNGPNPAWIPYHSDLYFSPVNDLVQVYPDTTPPYSGTYPGYGVETSIGAAIGSNLLTADDAYFITDTPGLPTNSNWKNVSNTVTVSGELPAGIPALYPDTTALQLNPVSTGNMVVGLNYYPGSGPVANIYPVAQEYTYAQLPYGEVEYGLAGAGTYVPVWYEWMVSTLNNDSLVGRTVVIEMYYYADDGTTVLANYTQTYTETDTMTWPGTPFIVYGPTVAGSAFTGFKVTVEGAAAEEHFLDYAGLFLLPAPSHTPITEWVPPALFNARRISAAGRVYIPRHIGQYGTYAIELLYGGSPIATQIYQGTPNNFIDMEVVYVNTLNASPNDFQARIRQTNAEISELFFTSFLGVFFHPIQWSITFYDSDLSEWTTPKILSSVINNPFGFVVPNTVSGTANQFAVTLTAMAHGAVVNSFVIKPIYEQSPLTNLATINNYPNPFTNEIGSMRGTSQHPHFRLWDRFYPQIYSQQYLAYISNQTS